MIVLYPYITGLVAGAFIVSSLYHVFGGTSSSRSAASPWRPSLCFLRSRPAAADAPRPSRARRSTS